MSLSCRVSKRAFRVYDNGHEFLVIHALGEITTRGLTRDGRLHVQIQHSQKLSEWITQPKGTTHGILTVAKQRIPEPEASLVQVPHVIALFPWETFVNPLIITLEPLPPKMLRRILARFPSITAAFNAGRIYVPRGSEKLAKGLR